MHRWNGIENPAGFANATAFTTSTTRLNIYQIFKFYHRESLALFIIKYRKRINALFS